MKKLFHSGHAFLWEKEALILKVERIPSSKISLLKRPSLDPQTVGARGPLRVSRPFNWSEPATLWSPMKLLITLIATAVAEWLGKLPQKPEQQQDKMSSGIKNGLLKH
ncbi:hypothetical protein MHYP_G00191070 [Metynnis hypsauchen]